MGMSANYGIGLLLFIYLRKYYTGCFFYPESGKIHGLFFILLSVLYAVYAYSQLDTFSRAPETDAPKEAPLGGGRIAEIGREVPPRQWDDAGRRAANRKA